MPLSYEFRCDQMVILIKLIYSINAKNAKCKTEIITEQRFKEYAKECFAFGVALKF